MVSSGANLTFFKIEPEEDEEDEGHEIIFNEDLSRLINALPVAAVVPVIVFILVLPSFNAFIFEMCKCVYASNSDRAAEATIQIGRRMICVTILCLLCFVICSFKKNKERKSQKSELK